LASIHVVYVKIPSKGIAFHRLLWGGDEDTSESSIGNVISKSNHVDLIRSEMKVYSGRGNGY